ncbi:hypothetical protein LTR17_023585 [Elasticomyces elasticus]|nr:hypothetical protein LTR17_023585 [Elasticomyces elasticus]
MDVVRTMIMTNSLSSSYISSAGVGYLAAATGHKHNNHGRSSKDISPALNILQRFHTAEQVYMASPQRDFSSMGAFSAFDATLHQSPDLPNSGVLHGYEGYLH